MAKPYQIFIGCPFAREVRATYDRFKKEIEDETPLSLVLADTVGVSSSNSPRRFEIRRAAYSTQQARIQTSRLKWELPTRFRSTSF